MAVASLAGWTVGVTAHRRADEQAELLARRGARVVLGPTVRTVSLDLTDGVADATRRLLTRPPDVVVLTTGIGARAWFDAAESLGLGPDLLDVLRAATVMVRGPKAAGAAATAGLPVAWQAPQATSAELVAELERRGVRGQRVAVQLDGGDVPLLARRIAALGADVEAVPVYRWTLPDDDAPGRRLLAATCDGHLDAVTFTSAPALLNALAIAGDDGREDELRSALDGRVVTVSIGPVCSDTARRAGIGPAVEPTRHRLGAMVLALSEHAAATDEAEAVGIGERRVVLRAAAATVDGTVVELPPREHDAMAALLERPDVVVTKERLHERARRDGAVELHAVEAVVGRLRRRLDGLLTVRTVPRRGYVLTAP
jgi:uroporphyrinogen-III synthase